MFTFGLGGLFYVAVLLINAIAILSEDRFLARSTSTPSSRPLSTPLPLLQVANAVPSYKHNDVEVLAMRSSTKHMEIEDADNSSQLVGQQAQQILALGNETMRA
ncbi:hypothetical protein SLS61_000127 [Didymella pomorum]